MLTANHILIAFAIVCLWLGSLWLHPFARCPRCHGKRMVIKGGKDKPRPVRCRKCKGVGRRQRPGSRTLHRIVRRIRRELDRQRKQRQAAAAASQED
jgi:hypothetical protein